MGQAFFLLAPFATGTGCMDSGQTGSPAAPTYDSFSPSVSGTGGDGGIDGGGACYDNYSPAQLRYATDFAKVFGNYLVVVAEPSVLPAFYATPQRTRERGLLIFDLSVPGEPALLGELLLEGSPRALVIDDNGVASIVMYQQTQLDSKSLPEAHQRTFANHLIRVDLSDPTSPKTLSEVTLEDDFWSLRQVGTKLYVLGALWDTTEAVCSVNSGGLDIGLGVESCPTGTLQLTTYQATGTELLLESKKGVGGDGYRGFVTEDGYVAVAAEKSLTAAWVEPTDGSVRVSKTIDYDGPVRVAALQGGVLAVVVDDPTLGTQLRLYSVADGQVPNELGRVTLTTAVERLSFTPDATALLLEAPSVGGIAMLVDIRDPAQPKASPLNGAREAALVGGALVGLGPNAAGKVVASLWDSTNLALPQLLQQVETNTPYVTNYVTAKPRWTVPVGAGLLLYPTLTYVADGSSSGSLLVVRTTTGSLEVASERTAIGDLSRPLSAGAYAYGISEGSLEVVPFDTAADLTTIALYPQPARFVVDEQRSGDQTVRLVREGEVVFVEVQTGASAPVQLPLSHFAEALRLEDGRAIALGLRRDSRCDSTTAVATPELSCPIPDQAGISVVALGDKPRLEGTILLSSAIDAPELPPDHATTSANWCGYVSLGDGRLVLPVSRVISCSSTAACDALGLAVSEGMAVDGCAGGKTDCNTTPYVTYTGAEQQSWFYVLDLNAAKGPTLLPGVKAEGTSEVGDLVANAIPCEGPLDLTHSALVSGTILGLTTTEFVADSSGSELKNAQGDVLYRTWLHLLTVGKNGTVTWNSRMNIPGTPIALRDEGTLAYTVAAEYDGKASVRTLLQRMSLHDGGAYVEQTLDLGGRSHGSLALDGRGWFIQGPAELCTESPTVQVFSVNLDDAELTKGPTLALPNDNWGFATLELPWDQGAVVLDGGPLYSYGRLELDVSDEEAKPSIVRYFSLKR